MASGNRAAAPLLPFYARNFLNVRQWAAPVEPDRLMPTLVELRKPNFHGRARHTSRRAAAGRRRRTRSSRTASICRTALKPSGTGIVWVAVEDGEPIEHSNVWRDRTSRRSRASLVQVTNLGISVKDSPQNTLIFVTRLDTAAPVAGRARVDRAARRHARSGPAPPDADGVAIAPDTRLRNPNRWWEFAFLVMAEKDGDVAYAGSDWNEGVRRGSSACRSISTRRSRCCAARCSPIAASTGSAKRCTSRRSSAATRRTASGCCPSGTDVFLTVRDSRNRVVDERTIKVNAWSSGEWTFTLPADGALGNYAVRAVLASDRPKAGTKPEPNAAPAKKRSIEEEDGVPWNKTVRGSFLVAAYRRPDFRVDVTLTGDVDDRRAIRLQGRRDGPLSVRRADAKAADALDVHANAGPVGARGDPRRSSRRIGGRSSGGPRPSCRPRTDVASDNGALAPNGQLPLVACHRCEGWRAIRVHARGRRRRRVAAAHRQSRDRRRPSRAVVHRREADAATSIEQKDGVRTELVAVGLDGAPVAGIPIDVTLTQVQWISVRRAEGNGFYSWETQRKDVPVGRVARHERRDPVPARACRCPPAATSSSRRVRDAGPGRFTVTRDVVLRARRGLHRVGALRPQSHRPRSPSDDLQARRHGARS